MNTAMYDRHLAVTTLKTPQQFSPEERQRIDESIRINGMAVVKGFLAPSAADTIRQEAEIVCSHGFGVGDGLKIPNARSGGSLSFRYPFLCSRGAVDVVTNESLLSVLEGHLGQDFVIHNAQFQVSLPANAQKLDYHIDCGSVKALNPRKKVGDFRLRTIVYLTDVTNGGFSYILGSRKDALAHFLPLPYDAFFDPAKVPTDPDRHITVHEPAGTLIIFDAHGLHRPEIPHTPRVVLNTWFAKRDFSGILPATPFNLSYIPKDRRHRLHIFEGERNECSVQSYHQPTIKKTPSMLERMVGKMLSTKGKPKKKVNLAYHE